MSKGQLRIMREKFLSDCPPDKSFWTCNGTVVRNVYELKNTINALNENGFKYHVNNDNHKNDFATWIHDVVEDQDLAGRLKNVLEKGRYVAVIEKRIKQLESA